MKYLYLIIFYLFTSIVFAQRIETQLTIHFDKPIREWDGFGVNYVETRHTRNYTVFPQDYGGFKYLDEMERQQVIDLVFGEDGLKPGIIKMFADPFMEPENDNDDPFDLDMSRFDFTTTTRWMRYFAEEGLKKTRSWGGDLTFLAGLYGPPAFTTIQKMLQGRDMHQSMKYEVAEYIIAWAKYLRQELRFNVQYISMQNEGYEQRRWRGDGRDHPSHYAHDYNMWWPYWQIVDFLKYADDMLYVNNMLDVKLTCGETTNWRQFHSYMNWDSVEVNLARAIAIDQEAIRNLGLITSHGFGKKFDPDGINLIRKVKPGLHAWTTSYTWGNMDLDIVEEARELIYTVGCNGLIPWAIVHNDYESDKLSPPRDFRVSSNANSPIKTNDGEIGITKAYYFYKQMCRFGQPGMEVSEVTSNNEYIQAIAFGNNRSINPDAFVVINNSEEMVKTGIEITGLPDGKFQMVTTSDVDYGDLNFEDRGEAAFKNGAYVFNAPPKSATTFYAIEK